VFLLPTQDIEGSGQVEATLLSREHLFAGGVDSNAEECGSFCQSYGAGSDAPWISGRKRAADVLWVSSFVIMDGAFLFSPRVESIRIRYFVKVIWQEKFCGRW
jgi:hypothetical protein